MSDDLTRLLERAAVDADSIALSVDHMIRSGRLRRRGRTLLTSVAGVGTVAFIAAGFLLMPHATHSASQVGGLDLSSGRGADISHTATGALVAVFHDPYATAATLRAVFRQRSLNIRIELTPASPSLVGRPVTAGRGPGVGSGRVDEFGNLNNCSTAPSCPAGITVTADFTGQAFVAIGVAATAGQNYTSANDATAFGEALSCSNILGSTVGEAQRILAARHLSVDQWRGLGNVTLDPRMSGDLVVNNAVSVRLGHLFLEAEPASEFAKYPAKNLPCYSTPVARAG